MANTRVYVTGLDQGLDTNIASSMIDEKAAVDLLNVRWNEGGVLSKRDGFIDWAAALVEPKYIGRLAIPSKREILAIDGTGLKSTQNGIWVSVTGATFSALANTYTIPQIKTRSFIWNSIDPGTVYDGTVMTRPGTIPNGGFSTYYKGYHICAGVPGQPSRVYFSTIDDTADFTNLPSATTDGPDPDNATEAPGTTIWTGTVPNVAQFVDVSASDGDAITLLIEFQDFLIIGKEHSLWSVTMDGATNKPVIQLISRSIGCVSQRSAVAVQNDVYFLSDQGPLSLGNERNYLGSLRTNLLGEKIKRITDGINPEHWKRATATYHDRMYILSIPYGGSTKIDKVLMLDTRFGGWAVWDNMNARCWLSHVSADNKRHLYFLKEDALNVSEVIPGYYYDNSAPIVAFWRSKSIDAGALDVTKRWTYFTLFMRNIGASADVTIMTELETLEPENIFSENQKAGLGFRVLGRDSWIGPVSDGAIGEESSISTGDDAWRTSPNLEGRTFTFEVRNDKAGENFFLAGFSLEYISLKAYYFDQSHTF